MIINYIGIALVILAAFLLYSKTPVLVTGVFILILLALLANRGNVIFELLKKGGYQP